MFLLTDAVCPGNCVCDGLYYMCQDIEVDTSMTEKITPDIREL